MNQILTTIFQKAEKNIIWNMLGGGWNGLLIVVTTPFYISAVGIDGFGIIGLWLMMLSLTALFDIGIGSTILREYALHFSSQKNKRKYLKKVFDTFEILFFSISLFLFITLISVTETFSTSVISSEKYSSLELKEISTFLFSAVCIQFPLSIYVNGLSGIQKHGVLNLILVFFNTLRHILGLKILFELNDLVIYFGIQIIVSFVQIVLCRIILKKYSKQSFFSSFSFDLNIIKGLWKFSLGMSLTSIFALILANFDRVLITIMLNTEDLGYYTIAYSAAIILQMGIQPFYKSYYPRYSELFQKQDNNKLEKEYFKSCSMMSSVMLPIIFIAFLFSDELFIIWIGNADSISVEVFRLLVIGIGLSGLMWLPAALQHAFGWTTLHALMLFISIIIGTPLAIVLIKNYGILGATAIWLVHGFLEISVAIFLMHLRILRKKLIKWYLRILFVPSLLTFFFTYFSSQFIPTFEWQILTILWVLLTGFSVFLILIVYNRSLITVKY